MAAAMGWLLRVHVRVRVHVHMRVHVRVIIIIGNSGKIHRKMAGLKFFETLH